MTEKRKSTPVYLNEEDKKKLSFIAFRWGLSQSAAIQRLIREKEFTDKSIDVIKGMDVALLPFVPIMEFSSLPLIAGIYIVCNAIGRVVYVGKANGLKGLRGRWNKQRASEYKERGAYQIRFFELNEIDPIDSIESELMTRLKPLWNVNQTGFHRPDLSYLDRPEWSAPEEFTLPEN